MVMNTTQKHADGMVEIVLDSMSSIQTALLIVHSGLAMENVMVVHTTQPNACMMVEIVCSKTKKEYTYDGWPLAV